MSETIASPPRGGTRCREAVAAEARATLAEYYERAAPPDTSPDEVRRLQEMVWALPDDEVIDLAREVVAVIKDRETVSPEQLHAFDTTIATARQNPEDGRAQRSAERMVARSIDRDQRHILRDFHRRSRRLGVPRVMRPVRRARRRRVRRAGRSSRTTRGPSGGDPGGDPDSAGDSDPAGDSDLARAAR